MAKENQIRESISFCSKLILNKNAYAAASWALPIEGHRYAHCATINDNADQLTLFTKFDSEALFVGSISLKYVNYFTRKIFQMPCYISLECRRPTRPANLSTAKLKTRESNNETPLGTFRNKLSSYCLRWTSPTFRGMQVSWSFKKLHQSAFQSQLKPFVKSCWFRC